jgi:hypothetical protein
VDEVLGNGRHESAANNIQINHFNMTKSFQDSQEVGYLLVDIICIRNLNEGQGAILMKSPNIDRIQNITSVRQSKLPSTTTDHSL